MNRPVPADLRALVAGVVLLGLLAASHPGLAQDGGCPEPNDSPDTACSLTSGAIVESLIERAGDIDVYRFVIGDGGGRASLELTELPADYDLYLIDVSGGVLGQSVREGSSPESLHLTLQPGTYFAIVQADPAREVDPTRRYVLRLSITGGSTRLSAPAAPAVEAEPRRVLLSDDFDEPTRTFLPRNSTSVVERAHIDGEYSIRNISPLNDWQGVMVPATQVDSVLAVDVRLIGQVRGRFVTFGCRRTVLANIQPQPSTSYRLILRPDLRTFELNRVDSGATQPLISRRVSDAIRADDQWNHVELSCIGSSIVVSANGTELGSVQDGTYRDGHQIITIGGPPDAMPHAEARLDNLVVYGP